MQNYDKQFLARLMLKKYASAELPVTEVMTMDKEARSKKEAQDIARYLKRELEPIIRHHKGPTGEETYRIVEDALHKNVGNREGLNKLIKGAVNEAMKDKLPKHTLWKTLGLAAAIGAGGMLAEHGISSAYHLYKKHQAYKRLAAKYPKLRTAKGREAFEALARMAPEVAYVPILAGPILQRGLAYGDEMGLPSVIMDTHSKIKPRKHSEAASWITAVSKAQSLG